MLTQEEKAALEQRGILLRRHILELVRAAKAGHIGGDRWTFCTFCISGRCGSPPPGAATPCGIE